MARDLQICDVAVVGGGITGAAVLYVLSRYTNIANLVLFEKGSALAHVNSHARMNSQTLHFGDIETNYSLEKAAKVKQQASLLASFLERHAPEAYLLGHKMVLAVGKKEVAELESRFGHFKKTFPSLRKLSREDIAVIEPKIVEGRDFAEPILALFNEKGFAVDYEKAAAALVRESLSSGKEIKVELSAKVEDILRTKDGFKLKLKGGRDFRARFVVVAAGAHSLILAKRMGYGKNLGILPVAGSFYTAAGLLGGKVYTMQNPKLPFAAVHGNPDINDPNETRFGPTAKVLPLLERHNWRTFADFLQTSLYTLKGVRSLVGVLSDKTIFLFAMQNLLYDVPFLGKWFFIKKVRKIVPTIRWQDLEYGWGLGGIRPQVIDSEKGEMIMGEVKITEKGIIFDVTPSPGASVCLANAERDAEILSAMSKGYVFDKDLFRKDHPFFY